MTTAGKIGIDLILNSTSFKKSLNNIQTQANNAGSKISNSSFNFSVNNIFMICYSDEFLSVISD